VFGDPLPLTFLDPDHSLSENRLLTIASSLACRVLLLAHADRNDAVRIISARKAIPLEREQYEETN
jgi:uncharacterized protein